MKLVSKTEPVKFVSKHAPYTASFELFTKEFLNKQKVGSIYI